MVAGAGESVKHEIHWLIIYSMEVLQLIMLPLVNVHHFKALLAHDHSLHRSHIAFFCRDFEVAIDITVDHVRISVFTKILALKNSRHSQQNTSA